MSAMQKSMTGVQGAASDVSGIVVDIRSRGETREEDLCIYEEMTWDLPSYLHENIICSPVVLAFHVCNICEGIAVSVLGQGN